jgi:hypothetical protein
MPGGVTIRSVWFDGNSVNQLPEFVGDTVRVYKITGVDLKQTHFLNPRGLTTLSTATLAETFALQLLHCTDVVVYTAVCVAADGGPTATGLVSHWCANVVFKNSSVAGLKGQAFGTFSGDRVTFDNCRAQTSGHGFNIEAGRDAIDHVAIVNSMAAHCGAGVVVNGNYNQPVRLLDIKSSTLAGCHDGLLLVGVPSLVQARDLHVWKPTHAAINLGGIGAAARADVLHLAGHWTPNTGAVLVAGGALNPKNGTLVEGKA